MKTNGDGHNEEEDEGEVAVEVKESCVRMVIMWKKRRGEEKRMSYTRKRNMVKNMLVREHD